MKTITLLAGPVALALGSGAFAQCATVDPAIVPDIRIDPLDASGAAQILQPVTLTWRRTGMGRGAVPITYQILDEDTVGQRIGASAGPQVEWRSGGSTRNIGASRNESFALLRSDELKIGPNKSSEQTPVRLFVKNLKEDLPAGVYREQFTIRYWCGDPERSLPVELPGVLTVTVQVPNVLSASIAGVSQHGQIDFLDFAALKRSLAISVRSTGPYSVTARSLNSSAMLRSGSSAAGAADRIAYTATFGGRELAVDAATSLRNPRAGLGGQVIPLEVTVGDTSAKRAGTYRDTLFVTLAPVT